MVIAELTTVSFPLPHFQFSSPIPTIRVYFTQSHSVDPCSAWKISCVDEKSLFLYTAKKTSFVMLGFVSAVCAGFCAAIASTCAKLAMSPHLQRKFWCNFLLQSFGVGAINGFSLTSVCQTVSLFPLFVCIVRVVVNKTASV